MHTWLKEKECGQQTRGNYYVTPLRTGEAAKWNTLSTVGLPVWKEFGEIEANPKSDQEACIFFFFLVMFGGDAKVKLQSSEFMKMTDPNKCQAKI